MRKVLAVGVAFVMSCSGPRAVIGTGGTSDTASVCMPVAPCEGLSGDGATKEIAFVALGALVGLAVLGALKAL